MSDEQNTYRQGGSVGAGSEHLPPANYFRPAPAAAASADGSSAAAPLAPSTTRRQPSVPDTTDYGATVLRPAARPRPSAPSAPAGSSGPQAVPPERPRTPEEVLATSSKRTRKARLRLSRIDPWSVMKTVFLFSVAGAITAMVAVGVIWMVIESSGLLDDLNKVITTLVSTPSDPTPFDIHQFVNGPKVLGGTAVIAAINIVLITALGTLGSFLYNLSATMLGGLEVTLAED